MIITTASKSVQMLTDISVAAGATAGGGTYNAGDVVTVTATPKSGFVFINWTVAGSEVSTNASYSFNASANDTTYTANFAPEIVTEAANGNLGIVVEIDETAVFNWGDYQPIQSATANLGLVIEIDESAVFKADVYQPIRRADYNMGVVIDFDQDGISNLLSPQIIRNI